MEGYGAAPIAAWAGPYGKGMEPRLYGGMGNLMGGV